MWYRSSPVRTSATRISGADSGSKPRLRSSSRYALQRRFLLRRREGAPVLLREREGDLPADHLERPGHVPVQEAGTERGVTRQRLAPGMPHRFRVQLSVQLEVVLRDVEPARPASTGRRRGGLPGGARAGRRPRLPGRSPAAGRARPGRAGPAGSPQGVYPPAARRRAVRDQPPELRQVAPGQRLHGLPPVGRPAVAPVHPEPPTEDDGVRPPERGVAGRVRAHPRPGRLRGQSEQTRLREPGASTWPR